MRILKAVHKFPWSSEDISITNIYIGVKPLKHKQIKITVMERLLAIYINWNETNEKSTL
uniref:Uncharacterized protein n=1 Tax=Rhizophora mucronata TaxID=61149 RepID=A0A2P2P124_RHIMU